MVYSGACFAGADLYFVGPAQQHLTLPFAPRSRFGDNILEKLSGLSPTRDGAAVLKGLSAGGTDLGDLGRGLSDCVQVCLCPL